MSSVDSDMPTWVIEARRFIATGRQEFLERAAEACADQRIAEFLRCPELVDGGLLPARFEPLASSLLDAGRHKEGIAVLLLPQRTVALMADAPDMNAPNADGVTTNVCTLAASLSRQAGFMECEARFVMVLGSREAKLCRWPDATRLVTHCVGLFRGLAGREPSVYRSELASALGTLSAVHSEMCRFPQARAACEEAVQIRRELRDQDAGTNRLGLAMALHNLGSLLAKTRELAEARTSYEEALSILSELASTGLRDYRPDMARTLNSLGMTLCHMRLYAQARVVCEQSLAVLRELDAQGPRVHRPAMAETLCNLGAVLQELRQFPQAQSVFEEGLSLCRELAGRQPGVYRRSLAATLNNLGAVLEKTRQFQRARAVFEESLQVCRELADQEPAAYRSHVAGVLGNLGGVLREMGQLAEARGAFEEAMAIYRQLAGSEPDIYRPDVARCLNSTGNILQVAHRLSEARAAYEESCLIYDDLAARAPTAYRRDLASTLGNLVYVLGELGDVKSALGVSREAIRVAETTGGDSAHHHLAKGMVLAGYRCVLSDFASRGDLNSVFRCLAAQREGGVLVTGERMDHDLSAAGEKLSQVAERVGRTVRVLVVEPLSRTRLLLAVLGPQHPFLEVFETDSFTEVGEALFHEMQQAFGPRHRKPPLARNAHIRRLAMKAWTILPDPVRRALVANDYQVLISGDPYWTMFPWEALCLSKGEGDFLGLRCPLVRWGPLTAGALAALGRVPFGNGDRTAAVIAPWDVSLTRLLLGTAAEARRAGTLLTDLGYELRPGGKPCLGTMASTAVMNAVLRDPPSVVHFTGHGSINGNEEVMLLWDSLKEFEVFRYSRAQFEQIKIEIGDTQRRLLANGPLVVLNSCLTGRVREHGGQREDLVSALLTEGAAAVVASPLLVYDRVGLAIGTQLYGQDGDGIGEMVLGVRRHLAATVCAEDPRLWPAWMLIACHGNPYARLPHQPGPG